MKGRTILQLMQEQEPLNDYTAEEICQLYCHDGPMPCGQPCSWLKLFTKKRFIDAEAFKMQREADRDKILTLLGQFPPYHGEGHNYTKQEVEAWLAKARSMFVPIKSEEKKSD